jgi:Na+/phosphate symporter
MSTLFNGNFLEFSYNQRKLIKRRVLLKHYNSTPKKSTFTKEDKRLVADFFEKVTSSKDSEAALEKFLKLFSEVQQDVLPLKSSLQVTVNKIHKANTAFDAYVVSTYPTSLAEKELTTLIEEATFHINSFRDKMEKIRDRLKHLGPEEEKKKKRKRIRGLADH